MAAKQFTRAYPANMSSLDALKQRCEGDEAGLMAKLISLQLATDTTDTGTVNVTGAKYERVLGVVLGHLIFEEYTDDVDAGSRTAIHQTNGEPLVCKGQAYINGQAKNVIVFREKP
jgi:hypothetical protein